MNALVEESIRPAGCRGVGFSSRSLHHTLVVGAFVAPFSQDTSVPGTHFSGRIFCRPASTHKIHVHTALRSPTCTNSVQRNPRTRYSARAGTSGSTEAM